MTRAILSTLAGLIVLCAYWPYSRDIVAGRVKPARSTRIMFVVLLSLALFQQGSLGSKWGLAVTIGETIGAFGIFLLALIHGEGGLKRLDLICYVLLAIDMFVWLTTGNALVALHLTVLADVIAFTPTLVKTWRRPQSETSLFFVVGTVAPLLNVLAARTFSYAIVLFPVYLSIINALEVILISRPRLHLLYSRHETTADIGRDYES